jgi:hypothetical protein
MTVVAIVEFKGGTALKCLDRTAPRRLATNQVVFGCLLLAYASMGLWNALHAPGVITSDPQLTAMLAPFRELERTIYAAVYGSMMLAAVLGPGGAAWFYSTRTKHVDHYLRNTPKWIIELQQAGMSL